MTTGGNEFLSARIDFEIPQEAMSQMREFNNELERTRVNSESAARGVDSFMRYIDLMNAAQERTIQTSRNLAANLERILQIQERAGQAEAGTAVPQQYTAPWSGGAEGMGGPHRDVRPLPTTVPAVGGSQAEFDHLMANDPRAYLNARAAWGGRQPGEQMPPVSISDQSLDRLARTIAGRDHDQQVQEAKSTPPSPGPGDGGLGGGRGGPPSPKPGQAPWEAWRNRAAQWTGAAGTVMSGLGMGGSMSGMLGAAGRAMQGWGAARQRQDGAIGEGPGSTVPRPRRGGSGGTSPSVPTEGETEEGGNAGEDEGAGSLSLGQAAGMGGAALGVGLGVFGAIQKGGQEVQRYRNLGSIRGGGFGEGFGYEMQARMMAMNPFITTEQSRQIMQSALTQGYTGKEFDTVTQFMANNLKEMNMSVAESSKLLQKSAQNSNESIQSMAENLEHNMTSMKDLSKTGYNTLPYRQEAYEQVYGAALQSGANPQAAGREGLIAGQEFSDMPGMKGVGPALDQAAINNPNFGYMMMQFGGANGGPMRVPGANMGDPGSIAEALQNSGQFNEAKWRTLKRIAGMSPNVGVFQRLVGTMLGVHLDRAQAKNLYQAAKAVGTGTDFDPLKSAKDVQQQDDKEAKKRRQVWGEEHMRADMGGPLGLGNAFGGNAQITPDQAERYAKEHGYSGRSEGSEIEDQVMQAYGGMPIEVGSADKGWKAFDPSNQDMIRDLKSGKMRIRERGDQGPGDAISDLPGSGKGKGGMGGAGNQVHGQLQITVHPANMRSVLNVPSFIPLTANEQAANSGYGNATKNNPPPGDGITSRGARGG
jgi:hypothetical protein